MKKLLALGLCLTLLSACESAPIEAPIEEPTEEVEVVEEETIGYENSEYGFSLELPMNWEDYVVTERDLEWVGLDPIPSYDFGFEDYPEIFNVSIYTLEQWEIISNFEGPQPPKLDQTETWVFAGSGGHDAPEEYLNHLLESSEILDSFKLL